MAKRSGQEGQDEAQDAKRRPQEGQEEAPRGTRAAPRGPRGGPKRAKRRQKRAKRACSLRGSIFDTPPTQNGQSLLGPEENHTFGAIDLCKACKRKPKRQKDQGNFLHPSHAICLFYGNRSSHLDGWPAECARLIKESKSYTPLNCLWQAEAGGGLPSPAGEHRRPPAFLLWHFGVIFFLALVDLCDLGNMDMCKGGEREREIYWIAYEMNSSIRACVCVHQLTSPLLYYRASFRVAPR